MNFNLIENMLLKCWSIKTSSKWTSENPYKGQCGVTAMVIQELIGGEILKTKAEGQWHFYNKINEERIDFTRKQFDFEVNYQDIPSSRDEAFADTNKAQYMELKTRLLEEFKLNRFPSV